MKKAEKKSIRKMVKKLRRLNLNTKIRIEQSTNPAIIIVRCADCSLLRFPWGYYYLSEQDKLTNYDGRFEEFEIMTEYDYLCKLA